VNESEPLWGGRFVAGPAPEMMRLSASIDVDIALLGYDLAATKAHARALEKAGLLDGDSVFAIADACDAILTAVRAGELAPNDGDEDVHSFVERSLTERLGDTGRRIHAGRSRNDLVVTGLRLWCRDAATELTAGVSALVGVIAELADNHAATVMPGYTHLQRAQPVSLGFHLAAHGFALLRDGARFEAARSAADVSSLGAGALAGTTLPIDPSVASSELGFVTTFDNAMDAVSDRDFAVDLAYAAAMCCVHLSRLGEEIVLWTSSEFSFAHLDDRWSTGSSMMPQKRNPDIAELVRGRAAPAIGELTSLLTLLKGLPLAYDRDLQEDKALVFRIVERTEGCLEAMAHLLASLTFDEARLAAAARGGDAWATDLAEALVARGLPFRTAHEKVGELVRVLEGGGRSLDELTGEELVAIDAAFEPGDIAVVDPTRSIAARANRGGTAPDRVREQAALLRAGAARLGSTP
jgi:argininosuccinate lyase